MSPDDFQLEAPPTIREPAVSYEIVARSVERGEHLLYLLTDAPAAEARPARFVSRPQAESVARSLEEIETKGRTFSVAPSSAPAPHFVGRFVEAI